MTRMQRYLENYQFRESLGYGFALSMRWHVARVGEKHAGNPKTNLIACGGTWTECKTRRDRAHATSPSKTTSSHTRPVCKCHTRVDEISIFIPVLPTWYSWFPFPQRV